MGRMEKGEVQCNEVCSHAFIRSVCHENEQKGWIQIRLGSELRSEG